MRIHVTRSPVQASRPLSVTLLCGALAVAAAGALTLMVPVALGAARLALQGDGPTVSECAVMTNDTERLACFDQIGKRALRPPAKGAFAPAN